MEELRLSIDKLIVLLSREVKNAFSDSSIQPEEEALFQWKLKDFRYTESGIESSGAKGAYSVEKTWLRAHAALTVKIQASDEWKEAKVAIDTAYPGIGEGVAERAVGAFVSRALSMSFQTGGTLIALEIKEVVDKLLNDLSGGTVVYKATVWLQGVTLSPERVNVAVDVVLRQPTREDLEKPVRHFYAEKFLEYPTAILEIETRGTKDQGRELQTKVEQTVALLRLFGAGSVQSMSYEMTNDSIISTGGFGKIKSGKSGSALETYKIGCDDLNRLKSYWQIMASALPKDIYDFQRQTNHITVAYDRYSDALMQGGSIDRRIANAIMGLEALYLNTTYELSFRLGLMVSKMMGVLGKDALDVREHVGDAYEIRSSFAHGGHLGHKMTKKLQRKYSGDVKNLLLIILGYLRVSIIVQALCCVEKEFMIDLIEDALLEIKKDAELRVKVEDAIIII